MIRGQICIQRGRVPRGGELVADHLQLERVFVALESRHQHPLARGLAAARHVTGQRCQHAPRDALREAFAVAVERAHAAQLAHASQCRSDDLAVQHRRRDAVLDRGRDRSLCRLGVASLERRPVDLERALRHSGRVVAGPLARVWSSGLDHFQERVQQHRVEVAAAFVAHHLQRLFDGERLAVHTVARERVEDIGHRHDAALDWDRLPGKPARISAPVPLFVMMLNHRKNRPWKLNRIQNHRADLRVLFHLIEFF